jgi:hypothetical protein
LIVRPHRRESETRDVDSSDTIPSDDWVALDHLWEDIADAWFKPGAEAPTFRFRIPRDQFEGADPSQPVTVGRLLQAAAIPTDEVESWHLEEAPQPGEAEASPDLSRPLPPPPPEATHLTVIVRTKPPAARDESGEPDMTLKRWQALDACWLAILGLEASIDALRLGMDGLRTELEAAFRRTMNVEEKCNALQSDVNQWTKAKSRVHYALPKVREFIHRATWATAGPERKDLEEFVENHIKPRVAVPEMDRVRERLEHFQKDRQVLYSQGNAVSQECRGVLGEIQRVFSTLQRNAADRARQQREARRTKGKYL